MSDKENKEIELDQHPVILWIPKQTIFAHMSCKIVDDDGETFTAEANYNNESIVKARKDFEEQVGDDDYDAVYYLTEKGLAFLEELKNG